MTTALYDVGDRVEHRDHLGVVGKVTKIVYLNNGRPHYRIDWPENARTDSVLFLQEDLAPE